MNAAFTSGRRIALVANTGWNIVRYRGVLIEDLTKRGFDVLAISDFNSSEARATALLGARPIRLRIEGAGTNPRADLRYFAGLTRLFRREKPDLVHLFTIKPIVYGVPAARLAGTPGIVASITGRGILGADQPVWLRRVVSVLLRAALAGRVHVTFQNESDLTDFERMGLVIPARTSLIPGSGIDTSKLEPDLKMAAVDRRSFVMASRMLWSKGVADFVAAARTVKERRPDSSFLLFGGARDNYGSQNPDFIDRAWLDRISSEGVVAWRGRADPSEVEAAMRVAAAVVLPSYYAEGVPRSLIEAAAAGTPIITTDTPGCRDTVWPGRSGYLCAPRSPEDLARAMLELVTEPSRIATMGAEGRRLALECFDKDRILGMTLAVYEAALRAGGGRRRLR